MNFLSTFAVNMIIQLIKSMMDNGLADQIGELVGAAFDFDLSGEEKKAAVQKELRDVGGVVGDALADTTPALVNIAIEAFVLKGKTDAVE